MTDDIQLWASELSRTPSLPPDDVQKRFVGKSGLAAFSEAIRAYKRFVLEASEMGLRLGSDSTLLDFGCGWGRFSWVALRDFKAENIFSVDPQPDALRICRNSNLPTNLVHLGGVPPSSLRDGSIDLILAYSVFSHLSEEKHFECLHEFRRLLRPGGVLAVTTRGRSFIGWVRKLKEAADVPAYARGSASVFDDIEDTFKRYDAGEFVFELTHKTGPLAGFYGEACIPRQYVEREWTKLFADVRYIQETESGLDQSVMIARKD